MVVGPTSSGKSELAIQLAERVGGEVVSADSQQVYLGMDIGTGKVDAMTRSRIAHHLIDVVRPDEDMTAARFADMADGVIADAARRVVPIVVAGGTGLYVRALLLGLFEGPPADSAIRARLGAEAAGAGSNAPLRERLEAIDPECAARIEENDLRRTIRALEVYELTGMVMSEHQRRHDHRRVAMRYPARIIGLCPTDRAELYRRIDDRVDHMMADGLLGEVEALRAAGYGPNLRSQQAIGYAELHQVLDGSSDLEPAVELIKRNSRRYARRQLSWYRSDPRVEWSAGVQSVAIGDLERYLVSPGTN